MFNSMLSEDEVSRYSQQIKLPEIGLVGQNKLKNARVLCVGLGGLGSPLTMYLAAAGVGTLGIIDNDVVDLSNLHRQILYRTSHIDKLKALAAKEQLLALNPNIQINLYSDKLNKENVHDIINQYDVVADGTDNFHTRYMLHDACFASEKPYIYASAAQFHGHCSVFHGKNGPCLRCLFPSPPRSDLSPSCDLGGVLGVVPGLMGVIQAAEIIKYLLEVGTSLKNRLLIVDILKMKFREVQVEQNPDCALCVHNHVKPELYQLSPCPQLELQNYALLPEQLFALLEQGSQIDLIDVRTIKEHEFKNIGGKVLPLSELPSRLDELDPSHTIVLYCQSGKRSESALNVLKEAGFSYLKYLKNGIAQVTPFSTSMGKRSV